MNENSVDKAAFGAFVLELRKERGLTQRELAEKVFVSDKAVSKWERGLSMPDVELLLPLGEALGVSVTELLQGRRAEGEAPLDRAAADALVAGAVELSAEEKRAGERTRRKRALAYLLCGAVGLAQTGLLLASGVPLVRIRDSVLLVELLGLFFGACFTFFVPETLPPYYDEYKLNAYHYGPLRLNLPGLRLSNSNWTHVLRGMRLWLLGAEVLFPAAWWGLVKGLPTAPAWVELALTLLFCLGFFIPAYVAGKRHE